jgi:hypothetical protein
MSTSTRPARSERRSRLPIWITLAAIVIAAVVVVLVVFQPQKLFIDDKVDEAVPVAAGAPSASSPSANTGAGPQAPPTRPDVIVREQGSFISRDHGTSGVAQILDVGGVPYLRIEDLDTDNGPDLYVYLTTNPAEGPEQSFDDDVVNLGKLKGNVGNQNYELPGDVDLARYNTVVIWCDRFDAAFGAADLV